MSEEQQRQLSEFLTRLTSIQVREATGGPRRNPEGSLDPSGSLHARADVPRPSPEDPPRLPLPQTVPVPDTAWQILRNNSGERRGQPRRRVRPADTNIINFGPAVQADPFVLLPMGRGARPGPMRQEAVIEIPEAFMQLLNEMTAGFEEQHAEVEPPTVPDHPSYHHCPMLFSNYPGRSLLNPSPNQYYGPALSFPGIILTSPYEWEIFKNSYTFYPALSAPEGMDDVFGTPYSECRKLYALCKPIDPGSILFYSSEELVQTFLTYQSFTDPKNVKKVFDTLQVNRLFFILDQMEANPILLETMLEIRQMQKDVDQFALNLSTLPGFEECLKMILETGMYMRGWTGKGPYLVTRDESYGKEADEMKSLEAVWALKAKLEEEWGHFAALPLFFYHQKRLIKDPECSTLMDRIKMVLNPERDSSCIRHSSNSFCGTGWYYLDKIYKRPPFDLSRFNEID